MEAASDAHMDRSRAAHTPQRPPAVLVRVPHMKQGDGAVAQGAGAFVFVALLAGMGGSWQCCVVLPDF